MAAAWALEYSDGSGNLLTIWQDGDAVRYAYSPVTPLHSSSGLYSGGAPAGGLVPGDVVVELWGRIRALAASTELHTPLRPKGSGAFTVAIGEEEQQFTVTMGAEIRDFDGWVREALSL